MRYIEIMDSTSLRKCQFRMLEKQQHYDSTADNRQAGFIPHGTADAHLLAWWRIHLHEVASSATRSSMHERLKKNHCGWLSMLRRHSGGY